MSSKNAPLDEHPTWVRWIGDSPWYTAVLWLATIGLVIVDLELLKPVIARAVQGGSTANWLATLGVVSVMATELALATELLMRYVERRARGWLTASILFATVWVASIVVLFQARKTFWISSSSDSDTLSQTTTATSPDDTNLWAALVLSLLMTMTGLVASALVAVSHDNLQVQRRKSARRRGRLGFMQRVVSWQHGFHARRKANWLNRITDLEARAPQQQAKISNRAISLEQAVRHRIATALGGPAATTGIFDRQE